MARASFRVGDPTRCGHRQRRQAQGRQDLFCSRKPNHQGQNHYHVPLEGVKIVYGEWVYPMWEPTHG